MPNSSGPPSDLDPKESKTVDAILKEIEDLKEAKTNSYHMPKTPALKDLRLELNKRIEDRLAQLLYLIADDPLRKNHLRENLGAVIRDINGLKGKILDGHLKTQLLF